MRKFMIRFAQKDGAFLPFMLNVLLVWGLLFNVGLVRAGNGTSGVDARTGSSDYDVYLLIGQSNMAGRGKMIASDTLASITGVWLLNPQGEPEKAVAPLNKYSTIRKGISIQQMCPGNSFSKVMHEKTGRKILLVVNARGGTNLKAWMPGAEEGYLNEAVMRTKEAMKYGKLKGILWHQGESNSGDMADYMENLAVFVAELRKQLDAEDVPFIAGEIAPWHRNRERFNPVIQTIGQHITNSDWVSSKGCGMLKDEKDSHFSREGQLLLGERYAEKMLEMLENM